MRRTAILKSLVSICLLSLLLMAFAGCGSQQQNAQSSSSAGQENFATIHDALSRDVVLPKKPERIVVTSASFLEPLHEVGGDVVGRPDSKTKMPDYAKDKAGVGKVYQIDIEKVLACEPDLVIVNKGMNEKLVNTLEENGIKTVVLDMKSYDDVKDEIRAMAKITGETQKGEDLIASGMTPLEKNPDAAPYSMETLVEQNPEAIFVTSMGKIEEAKAGMDKMMQENPAWQTVDAVKNGRVYYLPQDLFLLSPGIHYPEAAATMAKCLYPEAFAK